MIARMTSAAATATGSATRSNGRICGAGDDMDRYGLDRPAVRISPARRPSAGEAVQR